MTAQPDSNVLPLRPANERAGLAPKAQYAPERARAREADDAEPRPERRSLTLRVPRVPSMRLLSGLLQGGSLLATAAPPILTVWAGHQVAANYYRHWWAKYPRLAYGFCHAFIEVPALYLLAWSGRSPVLRCFLAVMILIILRLLGVHIIWSWL